MCWRPIGLVFCLSFSCQAAVINNAVIRKLQIGGTERPVRLETQLGQILDRECVARDVRRLWATGWFEDIRVEVVKASSGVEVLFQLIERPRYHLRRVKFDPASARRTLELVPGTVLDKLLAHKAAIKLRSGLVDEGYADAEVQPEIVPVSYGRADLNFKIKLGQRYRVEEVRFVGCPTLGYEELDDALRSIRVRRIVPGLPGVWRGWRWHAPYSQRLVEADLDSLRSFYFSKGYWDAAVGLSGIEFDENKATISVAVQAGKQYRVGRTEAMGLGSPGGGVRSFAPSDTATQEFCRCLREAQRQAEREGRLDFATHVEVRPATEPLEARASVGFNQKSIRQAPEQRDWVSLTAKVDTGPPYTVGRIEFRGNRNFADSTLRRMLSLHEGDLFDYGQLRRSLTRLNRVGVFRTLTEEQVRIERSPKNYAVDLILDLKEMPRGRWAFSGSVDPLSLLRPLQFSIGSRLPSWGSGTFELSTYFASLSLLPLAQPLVPSFILGSRTFWQPLIAVGRPYLQGQDWRSGFVVLPQDGWKATASATGLVQARRAVFALKGEDLDPPESTVPVWRRSSENDSPKFVGFLVCEAEKTRLARIRSRSSAVLSWALTLAPF